MSTSEGRACEACSGTGLAPESERKCLVCEGEGVFPGFDADEILGLVLADGVLRESFTEGDGVPTKRAFFVWVTVRGRTGVSSMEKIHADLAVSGDPFRRDLEALAAGIAEGSVDHHQVHRGPLGEDDSGGSPSEPCSNP